MRHFLKLAVGVALGLAPAVAMAAPGQGTDIQAPAQSSQAIPDGTIGKAGAALHDVAKVQEKYQGKMESASPSQKQSLGEQANAEAVQAIQSHGISVQEYSNIVHSAQTDPQVKQRLLSAANSQK
jgi:hypothetical protein